MPTLALQKIKNITQKIVKLKHTQEKLQQQIELKIISLLKSEKAFAIDFAILYGAIYELTQKLKKMIVLIILTLIILTLLKLQTGGI